MTNTLLTCRQQLQKAIGDGYREAVTTAIGAGVTIVSTNFNKWDGGQDDFYSTPNMFVYIEDKANAGVTRVTSDYATSTGTITVRGANLATDGANLATVQVIKFNPDNYKQAIQAAIRRLSRYYDVKINDFLITGNWLPNHHFDYLGTGAYATTPEFYATGSNATLGYTSTSTLVRGGIYSLKVTATAANGYAYLGESNYPKLLDLAGQTVSLYVWAYPNTSANDCFIAIYTKQANGTAQTLTSTTANPAGEFTRLELENQTLNTDLTDIQIRFGVVTNGQIGYFDNAYLVGPTITELLLPSDLRTGTLENAYLQTSSIRSDNPCDDLGIQKEQEIQGWRIFKDNVAGTNYDFLRLPHTYASKYKIHLLGKKPLTVPTTDAGTVEIDEPILSDLLIPAAASELYEIEGGLAGPNARDTFDREHFKWEQRFRENLRIRQMGKDPQLMPTRDF